MGNTSNIGYIKILSLCRVTILTIQDSKYNMKQFERYEIEEFKNKVVEQFRNY